MLILCSQLDLDAILTHADEGLEAEAGGASSGGAAFAQSFVADFKTSGEEDWSSIIPADQRRAAEEEERKKAVEEAAASTSRRRAAHVPSGAYEGSAGAEGAEDDDDEDDDEGESKGKARNKGGAKPGVPRKTGAQRALELSDRDIRVLIRGIQRWGDIRWRYDTLVEDGKLTGKNRGVLEDLSDELIKKCEVAAAEHERELQAVVDAGGEITSALRQRAVMVSVMGKTEITTNAETTLLRHNGLRLLFQLLDPVKDKLRWKVPLDHLKATISWTGGWTDEDDARLLLGIFKHGFGCWEEIQADESLGLAGKVFLDEGKKVLEKKKGDDAAPAAAVKDEGAADGEAAPAAPKKGKKPPAASVRPIPNAIHLVRRGDYLLKALWDAGE
jgi:chromodomain-helicase-DNA-binding protein 1